MNFANSKGLLPAIAGGITGLSIGQRTDPAGLMEQALATYRGLLGARLRPNAE